MPQERTTSRRALRDRPARRGDEREQALLATAERLLNEGAFESTPLAEIAASSGVSRPGFYFYFASKEALLSTLIVRTLDMLALRLPDAPAAGEADPVQALSEALHGAADLWYEHRAVLMAATESGSHEPEVFERIVKSQSALIAPTSTLLRQGTRVRSDRDARALAEMFTWMAERNFYVLSRKRPSKRRLHAMADRLLSVWVLAAGLEADAGQTHVSEDRV
jgi:TetR/AcrR family transcriptional regulator, ethionamide resistance regulator